MSERREVAPIVFRVLGGLLLVYLVVPLIYLIFRVGWQELASSYADPRTIRSVEVSLLTPFISVSVMAFFGVPLGYLLARPVAIDQVEAAIAAAAAMTCRNEQRMAPPRIANVG